MTNCGSRAAGARVTDGASREQAAPVAFVTSTAAANHRAACGNEATAASGYLSRRATYRGCIAEVPALSWPPAVPTASPVVSPWVIRADALTPPVQFPVIVGQPRMIHDPESGGGGGIVRFALSRGCRNPGTGPRLTHDDGHGHPVASVLRFLRGGPLRVSRAPGLNCMPGRKWPYRP